jgi:hypothetical protein
MLRLLACLAAIVGLFVTPATVAQGRDWSTAINQTKTGSFLIGNPQARIKIVEYLSYTCPHCAAFSVESQPVLRNQLIKSGTANLEIRNFVRDQLDLAAATLARCGGAVTFDRVTTAIFARQRDWWPRGMDFIQRNDTRMGLYPLNARLRAYADAAGLIDIAKANGIAAATIDNCFNNPANTDVPVALTRDAPADLKGTPGFLVNDKLTTAYDWATLAPILQAQTAH